MNTATWMEGYMWKLLELLLNIYIFEWQPIQTFVFIPHLHLVWLTQACTLYVRGGKVQIDCPVPRIKTDFQRWWDCNSIRFLFWDLPEPTVSCRRYRWLTSSKSEVILNFFFPLRNISGGFSLWGEKKEQCWRTDGNTVGKYGTGLPYSKDGSNLITFF